MKAPGQILESMPDAVRKPAALLAIAATLATGAFFETPAAAEAHPARPDAPAKVSPQEHMRSDINPEEQDSHDSELVPGLVVGVGLVAVWAVSMAAAFGIRRRK